MKDEQKRRINETLENAKKYLMEAERLAIEYGAGVRLQKAIGKLAGETEHQQHKI